MNMKLKKLRAELTKNENKIAMLKNKNGKLAEQITELENLEIVGLVRSIHMSPEQLEELLLSINPTVSANSDEEDFDHESH